MICRTWDAPAGQFGPVRVEEGLRPDELDRQSALVDLEFDVLAQPGGRQPGLHLRLAGRAAGPLP